MIDDHQSNTSDPELQDLEGAQSAESTAPTDPFQGISSNRLEAAFQYVERGLAIFPCEPGSKRPETPHGFKDASTELRPYNHQQLKGFAEFFLPDGSELPVNHQENWAMEPGRAGFTVIDIDPKNGGDKAWAELVARHGRATTRVVSTPSGGWHLWFRGTLPRVNRKLGPGIDTRCFGGYVLLPPSTVLFEDRRRLGHYAWDDDTVPIAPLPAWIVEEIEAAAAREAEIRSEHREQAYNGEGGDAFESWLSLIGDHEGGLGFYDPMLRAVGAGVALGMPADEILDRLQEAALAADRSTHSLAEIQDRLAKMPGAIRKFQANDAARIADTEPFEEPEEEEPDVEEPGEPDEPEEEEEEAADEEESWRAEDETRATTDNQKASSPNTEANDKPSTDHRTAVAQGLNAIHQGLSSVFETPWADKRLFVAAMGIGKSVLVRQMLAKLSDPAHPDPVSRAERDASLGDCLDPENEDIGAFTGMPPPGLPPGQILYVAHRHDLLRDFANGLKEDLRQCSWSEEAIERNVVTLEAREHPWLARDGTEIRAPLCRRAEEVEFLKRAGDFSISKSLCAAGYRHQTGDPLPVLRRVRVPAQPTQGRDRPLRPDDPCSPKHTVPCATQD